MYIVEKLIKLSVFLFLLINISNAMATNVTVVTEHLAPFQIVDSNSITGLSTEIVRATLDEASFDYDIEAYPWSISFNRAIHEENICIYSLARIPERKLLFQWIGHITTSRISLYSLKKSPININNLNDAKKYKTAVIKDDVTHHYLLSKGFVEGENLYVMSNYDALLQLLEMPSRQIDLIVINDDLINHRVNNEVEASKYLNVYSLDELMLDFYFACSLNTDSKVVDKLKTIMARREAAGLNSIIREKWKANMVDLL